MNMESGNPTIRLYLYTGLGFLFLYSIGEFFAYRETFVHRLTNSVFLISYCTVLNYLLFEKIIVLFKQPYKKIALAVLLLLIASCFYSIGLYSWRLLWIRLGIYIDYTPQLSYGKGRAVHTQFSIAGIIFFGGNMVLNAESEEILQPSAFMLFLTVFAMIIQPAKNFSHLCLSC